MLSGVETTKEKVLRIILAGQPELNQKLDAPELVQLAQRVRLRFHLGTLSATEMHAYIHHRLEVAGAGDRQVFAEDTYAEIFRCTAGCRAWSIPCAIRPCWPPMARIATTCCWKTSKPAKQELRWHEPQAQPSDAGRAGGAANSDGAGLLRARPSAPLTAVTPVMTCSTRSNESDGAEPMGRVIVVTEGRTTRSWR